MLNLGLGFGAWGSGLEHEHSDRLRKVQLRRSALHMQIYVETYLYIYIATRDIGFGFFLQALRARSPLKRRSLYQLPSVNLSWYSPHATELCLSQFGRWKPTTAVAATTVLIVEMSVIRE